MVNSTATTLKNIGYIVIVMAVIIASNEMILVKVMEIINDVMTVCGNLVSELLQNKYVRFIPLLVGAILMSIGRYIDDSFIEESDVRVITNQIITIILPIIVLYTFIINYYFPFDLNLK